MKWKWPIIGHKKIVQFLQKNIEGGKIAHAYLFYGPENLGKKTVAQYFALSLICQEKNKPCLECLACQNFLKDIHPDVVWLRKEEGKKNISIDQIRSLKEKIGLTGFTNGYKIVIIVNSEEMSLEAANSFLKILEEPPRKRVIILIANNLKNIPKTIVSRCQLLKFSLVEKKEIADYLRKKYQLSTKKSEEIAALALGHPGQADKFLSDKKFLDEYLARQEKLIKIIESGLSERLKISAEIIKEDEFNKVMTGWKNLIRDLILLKTNNESLIVNLSLKDKLKKIAEKFSFTQLYKIEKEFDNFNLYLRQNINLRLALDNFVISICH